VSLGGFESTNQIDDVYGQLVIRALSSRLSDAPGGSATLLASERNVRNLARFAAECGIELRSLPHDQALEELASASIVVTAPGLTTTFECFQLGRPTFFLPPRSFSQWCILKVLRTHALADHAMHWEDISERHRPNGRMPEEERNAATRLAIEELAATEIAQDTLGAGFSAVLETDVLGLANRQSEFLRSLGPNGAPVIAAALEAEVDT
jgi:hypothetical protein